MESARDRGRGCRAPRRACGSSRRDRPRCVRADGSPDRSRESRSRARSQTRAVLQRTIDRRVSRLALPRREERGEVAVRRRARFDHREVTATWIGDELRVGKIARESLTVAERRHEVFSSPEEERGLRDRRILALDLREALATNRGERGRDGAWSLEGGVHVLDEALGNECLVVERQRDAFVGAFLVPKAEERLA